MNKIFIYSPYWSTFGGGEKYILAIGELLAREARNEVTLLSTCRSVDKARLEKFSGLDLSGISFTGLNARRDIRPTVGRADCFVFQSNVREIASDARSKVQIVQIPYARITPASMLNKFARGNVKESLKDILRLRLLGYARKESSAVLTYSKFVHDILLENHAIENKVLPPPIHDCFRPGYQRKNIILSVGRLFQGLYNNKRYDVMTGAFRKMCDLGLRGWEYHIVGSAADDPESRAMIGRLREANNRYDVHFHLNEPFDAMIGLYNEATVFWHGAGYGVDETKNPENVEHFGMTTVEAMSAGCIPVVVDRGGQKEIVTDGVNGFLWDSVEELIARTSRVMEGEIDRDKLRSEARKRYGDYSYQAFEKGVSGIFGPLLPS